MTRLGGTLSDGSEGAGVIFRYDLTTGEYKVLHVFAKNASDNGDTNDHGFLSPAGGYYYGTTELGGKHGHGVLFRLRTDGSDFSIVHSFGVAGDGKRPFGSLVQVGEWFYSTTIEGGDRDDGTIFRLRPSDLRTKRWPHSTAQPRAPFPRIILFRPATARLSTDLPRLAASTIPRRRKNMALCSQ
jgi:uncharacterized repeat protein (TIGR03803 family)